MLSVPNHYVDLLAININLVRGRLKVSLATHLRLVDSFFDFFIQMPHATGGYKLFNRCTNGHLRSFNW